MIREAWLVAAMPSVFVLIWSTGFIVARYGMPHAPPLNFLAMRYGLSVLCFGVWSRWRARPGLATARNVPSRRHRRAHARRLPGRRLGRSEARHRRRDGGPARRIAAGAHGAVDFARQPERRPGRAGHAHAVGRACARAAGARARRRGTSSASAKSMQRTWRWRCWASPRSRSARSTRSGFLPRATSAPPASSSWRPPCWCRLPWPCSKRTPSGWHPAMLGAPWRGRCLH